MLGFIRFLRKFRKDESGATAIEYGLLAAMISIAGIGSLQAISTSISDIFMGVSTIVDGGASKAQQVSGGVVDGGGGG